MGKDKIIKNNNNNNAGTKGWYFSPLNIYKRGYKAIYKLNRNVDTSYNARVPTTGLIESVPGMINPPVDKKYKSSARIRNIAHTITNLGLAGIGLSAIGNYSPIIGAAFGKELYHGTVGSNLENILSTGLKTQYAGQAKRLNSAMLTNAISEHLSDVLGRNLTNKEMDNIANAYLSFKPNSGMGISDYMINVAKDIAIKNGVKDKELLNKLERNLYNRGKRIYFGHGLHTVTDWASGLNEGGIAAEKLKSHISGGKGTFEDIMNEANKNRLKRFLKPKNIKKNVLMYGDIATGGAASALNDVLVKPIETNRALKNFGNQKLFKNTEEALNYIKSKGYNTKDYGVVLGAKLKPEAVKGLKGFADFPLVGPIVGSNYGLRNLVKRFLPNYSPGRDISTSHDISPDSIRDIFIYRTKGGKDLVDRIRIEAPKRTMKEKIKDIGKGIKNMNKPALGMVLGGTVLLGTALFGNKIYDRLKHKSKTEKTKTAGLTPNAKNAIKAALKASGLVGLAGLAIGAPYYYADKLTHKRTSKLNNAALDYASRLGTANLVDVSVHAPTSLPMFGYGLGSVATRNIPGAVGVYVGSTGVNELSQGRLAYNPASAFILNEAGANAIPAGNLAGEKVDSFIKRHGNDIAFASGIGTLAGATGGSIYTYKRYYPMITRLYPNLGKWSALAHLIGDNKKFRKGLAISVLAPALVSIPVTYGISKFLRSKKLSNLEEQARKEVDQEEKNKRMHRNKLNSGFINLVKGNHGKQTKNRYKK